MRCFCDQMSATLVLNDLPQLIATPSEKLSKQEAKFFSQGLSYSTSHTTKKQGEMPFPLLSLHF